MRIAFLGSDEFSLLSLRACALHCDVAAVITQPDKPGHRGAPASRPIADAAKDLGIPVLQPSRLRDQASIDEVLALNIDAVVVAAYGQILPVELLDQPRFGGINVHPSLLPRWRGASPVAAAILAGDKTSGVCIMKMEAGLDTGPVFASRQRPISDTATTPELSATLARDGAELLVEVLKSIEQRTAVTTPQDDSQATVVQRFRKEDGLVDWSKHSAAQVDRMVRALQPWPGVTAKVGDVDVRIVLGRPEPTEVAQPGEIVGSNPRAIAVGTVEGVYWIYELQPPGKRAMSAADYLRGRRP